LGRRVLFSRQAFEYSLLWPDYQTDYLLDRNPIFPHLKCAAGKYWCVVDTDGSIYPCTHLIGAIPARNALASGMAQCFNDLGNHPCRACSQICHNEFNLLFGLNPWTVLKHVRNSVRSSWPRRR